MELMRENSLFKNGVVRRIFRTKGVQIMGGIQLHNEESFTTHSVIWIFS